MEARLAEVLQELSRQSELHREVVEREQQLQNKMQTLESELFTTGVSKDEQSHEKQQVSLNEYNLSTTLHLFTSVIASFDHLNCVKSFYF